MSLSALQRAVLHLLFTSLTTRAESNPVLELLSLQDVPINNHASFTCTVTGPLTIVKWKKNRAIIDTTDPHYKFNSNLSELDIDVVDTDDSGSYQCVAEASDKTVYESNSKSLRVLNQPSIQPTNTKTVACKGSPVTLSCSGSDFTHVFWLFRGVEIDTRSQSRYRIGGNFNEKLVISRVTLSDAGQYTCKAINQYDSLTSSAAQALEVEYPPVIIQGPQGGSFLEEYDITLFCNVTANPPAHVYWKKDGTFVEALGNKYQVDYVKGTLFIPNAPKSAAGMYACYANNSRTCSSITLSVVSKEAEVKVEDSGALPFYGPNAYRTIALGDGAAIKCSPNQSISESVVWNRDGKQLTSSSHLFFTADGVMMIKQATYNLSGTYECNFAGHSLESKVKLFQRVFLTVRGPPDAPHLFTPTVIFEMETATAFVNWTVPFDGNSRIDQYKVYFRPSGTDLWSSHAVDGSQSIAAFALNRVETTEFYVTASNVRNMSKRSNVRRVDVTDFVLITVLLPFPNETELTGNIATSTSGVAGSVVVTASSPVAKWNSSLTVIATVSVTVAISVAIVVALVIHCCQKRTKKNQEIIEIIPRRESALDLLPNDGNRQSGSGSVNSPLRNVEEGDDNVFYSSRQDEKRSSHGNHVAEENGKLQLAVEAAPSGVPQSQSPRNESLV